MGAEVVMRYTLESRAPSGRIVNAVDNTTREWWYDMPAGHPCVEANCVLHFVCGWDESTLVPARRSSVQRISVRHNETEAVLEHTLPWDETAEDREAWSAQIEEWTRELHRYESMPRQKSRM